MVTHHAQEHFYGSHNSDNDNDEEESEISVRDTAVLVPEVGGIGGNKAQNRIFLNNFLGTGGGARSNGLTSTSESGDSSDEEDAAAKNPMFPQLY